MLESCEPDMFAHKATTFRLFGLDVGDWSTLLLGLALLGLLIALF